MICLILEKRSAFVRVYIMGGKNNNYVPAPCVTFAKPFSSHRREDVRVDEKMATLTVNTLLPLLADFPLISPFVFFVTLRSQV